MAENEAGCARPAGAQVGAVPSEPAKAHTKTQESIKMIAKVGAKAPDFTAPAYYKGEFTTVKLSDYLGKWVLLCFYPGDFTFV